MPVRPSLLMDERRSVCMYVCIYVCMYARVHIHVYAAHVRTCIYTHTHTQTYARETGEKGQTIIYLQSSFFFLVSHPQLDDSPYYARIFVLYFTPACMCVYVCVIVSKQTHTPEYICMCMYIALAYFSMLGQTDRHNMNSHSCFSCLDRRTDMHTDRQIGNQRRTSLPAPCKVILSVRAM